MFSQEKSILRKWYATAFNFYSRLSKSELFSVNAVPVVFTTFHYICHCKSFLLMLFTFDIEFLAENWPVYIIIIISTEKNFLTQISDIMSCQISDFFVVLSYRWDCHQSVPSMYRNEHTNCGHLLRTRHDAHASSEGRRVLPDWERLAASGCLSQYSRDHSGRKGSQKH